MQRVMPFVTGIVLGASLTLIVYFTMTAESLADRLVDALAVLVAATVVTFAFAVYLLRKITTAAGSVRADVEHCIESAKIVVAGSLPVFKHEICADDVRDAGRAFGESAQTVAFRLWNTVLFARALGRLFAIVTVLIGFATFLAAHLEVEQMRQQNDMFDIQNGLVIKQNAIANRQLRVAEMEEEHSELQLAIMQHDHRMAMVVDILALMKDVTNDSSKPAESSTKETGDLRRLSKHAYARICVLADRLVPMTVAGREEVLSDGRAQLLTWLHEAKIDLVPLWNIGCSFEKADLSGNDLAGIDVTNARLSGANLQSASLRKATMVGCKLIGADASSAILVDADCEGADLTDCKVRNAQMSGVILNHARCVRTNFVEADMTKSFLNHCVLIGADLHGADLRGAQMHDVNMKGAHIGGANLDQVQIAATDTLRKWNVRDPESLSRWQVRRGRDGVTRIIAAD